MTGPLDPLRQHLELAILAYGGDLPLAARLQPAPEATDGNPPTPARGVAAVVHKPRSTSTSTQRNADLVAVAAVTSAPPRASTPLSVPTPAAAAALPDDLDALRDVALACRRCKLCEGRRSVVFGEGNRRPDVLFVGEAPGAVEDRTGRPFVGPAGQLLDKILANAMGLRRADVFIANVNKCRPPGNRDPEPDEVAACLPFLRQQVALLAPKVIVALGRIAAHNLLSSKEPMRLLRGRDLVYEGIPVVVTWHPAFLLRDPSHKRETWEDIKRVNRLLGRPDVPSTPDEPGSSKPAAI